MSSSESPEFWPAWIAQDLNSIAIWTISYSASKSKWKGNSAMHLADRGRNVLELLLTENDLKHGELILIGHSLGGLVIKQLIKIGESLSYENENCSKFIKRIKRVAFLGTPHKGSKLAVFGSIIRFLFRPSPATNSLLHNDANLRELGLWYKKWSKRNHIEHLILMESFKTRLIKYVPIKIMIVGFESADAGVEKDPIPI